jgi:hypothetical protein
VRRARLLDPDNTSPLPPLDRGALVIELYEEQLHCRSTEAARFTRKRKRRDALTRRVLLVPCERLGLDQRDARCQAQR